MSLAAKIGPAPRYGSVVQMATYAGLSPKTIRRLIDAGKVRGHKVGRRLLIPFADLDRYILRIEDHRPRREEVPAMSIATTTETINPATGRARSLSEEEGRARSEALVRVLDEIAGIADESDTDEVWSDVCRGIDESRPHRPLFEGQY